MAANKVNSPLLVAALHGGYIAYHEHFEKHKELQKKEEERSRADPKKRHEKKFIEEIDTLQEEVDQHNPPLSLLPEAVREEGLILDLHDVALLRRARVERGERPIEKNNHQKVVELLYEGVKNAKVMMKPQQIKLDPGFMCVDIASRF